MQNLNDTFTAPPLEQVTQPTVNTATAAYYLGRRPQTLRAWACLENGPLRPIRIHGRLAWPVAELRRLIPCAAFSPPIAADLRPNSEAHGNCHGGRA